MYMISASWMSGWLDWAKENNKMASSFFRYNPIGFLSKRKIEKTYNIGIYKIQNYCNTCFNYRTSQKLKN